MESPLPVIQTYDNFIYLFIIIIIIVVCYCTYLTSFKIKMIGFKNRNS